MPALVRVQVPNPFGLIDLTGCPISIMVAPMTLFMTLFIALIRISPIHVDGMLLIPFSLSSKPSCVQTISHGIHRLLSSPWPMICISIFFKPFQTMGLPAFRSPTTVRLCTWFRAALDRWWRRHRRNASAVLMSQRARFEGNKMLRIEWRRA